MQGLRHASRRALHIPVMQKTFAASVKAYSSEAASALAARKTKDRFELAKQFIVKFKAANNGQLPGITLLRKEVGGKYDTLREALEQLSKAQDQPDTLKQISEPKVAEEKTQEFAATGNDEIKKKSPLKEDSIKDRKETWQVSKGLKAVKTVDQAHSRTISKDTQSVTPVKDASKLVTDSGLITEDDDNDSDVAAPEYHHSSLLRMARQEEDWSFLNDSKKQNDGQAMKLNLADIKEPAVDIKQPVVRDGAIRIGLPHKAWDTDNTAAKHPSTDGTKAYASSSLSSLTTVVRIANLPQHITASKLKAVCETVASVHEVDLRRAHIADIHFNVDVDKMPNIFTRLRKLSIGPNKFRVFAAQRLSCGKNANSQFKPQDVHHYRTLRNILFSTIEQRLKYLTWQINDFRELQESKLVK